jgi:hypothetical protein
MLAIKILVRTRKLHLFNRVISSIISIIRYVNKGRMIKVKAILIVKISGKILFGNEYIPMPTKYKSKYVPIITANKGIATIS